MTRSLYIAVDFDGTCVVHDYPRVGRDIGAQPVLKALVAKGHRLILNTMRSGPTLDEAEQWFVENDIPLYGVNRNPDQDSWTQSPKVYAHIYIDDAALGIPLIAGEGSERDYVDWDDCEMLLRQTGAL